MVSGRYFLPKAPELCLKWIPDWEVTSVNSMGPEARAEVRSPGPVVSWEGLTNVRGSGDGAGEEVMGVGAVVSAGGVCLQPTSRKKEARKTQSVVSLRVSNKLTVLSV